MSSAFLINTCWSRYARIILALELCPVLANDCWVWSLLYATATCSLLVWAAVLWTGLTLQWWAVIVSQERIQPLLWALVNMYMVKVHASASADWALTSSTAVWKMYNEEFL